MQTSMVTTTPSSTTCRTLITSACKVGGSRAGLGRVPGGWCRAAGSAPPPCAEAEAEALTRVGQGSRKLEGWWLKVRQFNGLLVKRFHCARRNSKALSSQILLPALFVCVAMTVALSVPEIGTAAGPGIGALGLVSHSTGLWLCPPPEPLVGTPGDSCLPGAQTQAWTLWVLGRGGLGRGVWA